MWASAPLAFRQWHITVRGLKMFEKKLTAQMMIEAIQFDNPKMLDRSRTLFFKYFLIRCYLSVKNLLFSFCAWAII